MTSNVSKGGAIATTILGVILVAAILILVNVISAGTFTRLDLTEGKEFTISRATKDILGDLNDLVTVTVYMSEDMPTQLSTLRREISDVLDEYRNHGRGRLQVDFIDPSGNPELEQKLRSLGIPQITAQTLEKDQFQSVNIYLGMLISFADRQETLPVVQDTYTLEYDLTSAILKVSGEREYVVGVLGGEATNWNLTKGLTGIKEFLQRQFRVKDVNLAGGKSEVPADVDLLIVAGPEQVPDRVKYQLDQYVMRGGKAIFMIDGIKLPEDGGLQAIPVNSGIEDLLAHYGVRVPKALVLDRLNATASFSSGYVRYTLPYPYWVKAVPDLLNAENPVTNRLESIVLPWVTPLEVDVEIAAGDPIGKIREIQKEQKKVREELAKKMGVELPQQDSLEADEDVTPASPEAGDEEGGAALMASVLSRTSPQAWRVSGRYDLNPQQRFAPTGENASEITAVALSGCFESFYKNREVPSLTSGSDDESTIEATSDETPIPSSPETQVLVIGNAQFVTDQFLAQFAENRVFLQNAVDWLTLGDQLISIRSRGATSRPLKQISDAAKSTVKLIGILGAPLLVIAFGLIRLTIRRRTMAAREAAAMGA
ncbi:MAG: GldG family protein [Candidatus Eisenbacteria sp.]|nr:GldG family protein [Candidatus Eisenbacteria bacterium]